MGASAFTRGTQNLALLSTYLFSKGCLHCLCEGLMNGRHRPKRRCTVSRRMSVKRSEITVSRGESESKRLWMNWQFALLIDLLQSKKPCFDFFLWHACVLQLRDAVLSSLLFSGHSCSERDKGSMWVEKLSLTHLKASVFAAMRHLTSTSLLSWVHYQTISFKALHKWQTEKTEKICSFL